MLSGPKPGAHQRHIRAAVGTLATLLLLPLLARPGPLRLCLFWCSNGCKAQCNLKSVLSELQFHLLPPPARWSSRCLTWTSVYGQAGSCNSSRKTSALAHLAMCLAHVCSTPFVGQPLPTGGGAVLRPPPSTPSLATSLCPSLVAQSCPCTTMPTAAASMSRPALLRFALQDAHRMPLACPPPRRTAECSRPGHRPARHGAMCAAARRSLYQVHSSPKRVAPLPTLDAPSTAPKAAGEKSTPTRGAWWKIRTYGHSTTP